MRELGILSVSFEEVVSALREIAITLREHAIEYGRHKSPWPRLILALYLLYAGVRHLCSPLYQSWFSGITLAFHELGHVVFSPFGRTWMLLGGSILQLFIPALAALYLLLRQGDWFGLCVGQAWLGFSLWELATYVADANKERLALVSLGGNPEHDWSTLLTQWHVLNACDAFATVLRIFAFLIWLTAMIGAGALISVMLQARLRNAD